MELLWNLWNSGTQLQYDFFLLQTVEVSLIGLFSLASVCVYSIILWSSLRTITSDDEDRWSFKRSIKILSISAIIQNVYQTMFLIVQTTNITFNLLENVNTASKTTETFEALDQYFYCIFVYLLALCLMKPLVWPRLRFDTYIYLFSTIPAGLNLIIRVTMIFMDPMNNEVRSSINTATSVVSSFLIFLVPLTIVIISTVTNSRRQPEHFMKVSCQRMGVIFIMHLVISALHFTIFSFVQCHNYVYNTRLHQFVCTDHLTAENHRDNVPDNFNILLRNTTTTSRPQNPATVPTVTNVSQMVLNILSQLLLPTIPVSFLYTVRTILQE